MVQLVDLATYRAKEAVIALEALLDLARSGALKGLVYVAETDDPAPLAGLCGSYKREPLKALGGLSTVQQRLSTGMDSGNLGTRSR